MVISFFNVLYSLRLRQGAGIKFVGFLQKGGHSKSDLKIMCLVPCWLSFLGRALREVRLIQE
jgi:hypothetical protein